MKEAIIQYNDDPDSTGGHMLISWKELVRCKDCKNFDTYNVECMKSHFPNPPYDAWYCADGERRTE